MFNLVLILLCAAVVGATIADRHRRVKSARAELTASEAALVAEFEARKKVEHRAGEAEFLLDTERRISKSLGRQCDHLEDALEAADAADPFEMVYRMCEAFEQPVRTVPQLELDGETVGMRLTILSEEFSEHLAAVKANDIVEIADSIGDMIVVLVGTAAAYGIPLQAVMEEIHRSNMTKVDPDTGLVKKRADGKVLKPATFEEPRLARVLGVERGEGGVWVLPGAEGLDRAADDVAVAA